jgi:hypothetical protein
MEATITIEPAEHGQGFAYRVETSAGHRIIADYAPEAAGNVPMKTEAEARAFAEADVARLQADEAAQPAGE